MLRVLFGVALKTHLLFRIGVFITHGYYRLEEYQRSRSGAGLRG